MVSEVLWQSFETFVAMGEDEWKEGGWLGVDFEWILELLRFAIELEASESFLAEDLGDARVHGWSQLL
jgi:hypothetical protein